MLFVNGSGSIKTKVLKACGVNRKEGGRPKTKKVKLKTTPHEELLKELEYLRAENAYLKKLQALVEERIVRESGKEPKPSKD